MAAAALALAAAVGFLVFLDGVYPLRRWLLRAVVSLWAWQLYLSAALLAFGDMLLTRVLKLRELTALERLALGVPVGAVAFTFAMFIGGFLALYGPVFAVALPAAMLVAGAALGGRHWRELWPPAGDARPPALVPILATIFGVLCLGLLYLGSLSPEALNYDATWSHLVVSQDYAREGRIFAIPASWLGSMCHLASILYTWGFLVPGLGPPQVRWMMALHTELALFVWTLVGVAAAVRWFSERNVRGAWAVLFLFPGMFVYDSNLGGSADHVLAFFVPAALLAGARAAETLAPRWWALWGIVAAGAVLTKYQAAYLVGPLGLLLAAALARGAWRHRRGVPGAPAPRQLLRAPLAALVCLVVATAPHFLRNIVFYLNPIYPMGQDLFTASRPSMRDGALLANNIVSHWGTKPPAALGERLREAAKLWLTFSFRPHAGFSGEVPVLGSLFTLSLPLLLLLRRARRVYVAAAVAAGALLYWCWTYWIDRNIQTFLPLLAIATGAVLVRAWELGRLARVGVAALVAVQLGWSGDHFFQGTDRLQGAVGLIRSGYDGRAETRFKEYRRPYVELGQSLPKNARVLFHNLHPSLGVNRMVLLDWLGFQGLIDPRTFHTPREAWDRYRALGITHVVFHPGLHPAPTKQDEVIFAAFRTLYASETRQFAHLHIFPLPATPPPAEPPYKVLILSLPGYEDGIYRIEYLANWEQMPPHLYRHFSPETRLVPAQAAAQIGAVQAMLIGIGSASDPVVSSPQFQQVVSYGGFSVYVRRR